MNKKTISFIAIASCSIGYFAYLLNASDRDISVVANSEVASSKNEVLKVEQNQETVQPRKIMAMPPVQPQSIEIKEAVHVDEVMFAASQKAEEFLKASGKLREDLAGEVYLEFNSTQLLGLSKGDTFQLDIPGLQILHEIEVKEAYHDQFGNKTIEAQLPGQDMIYGSVFTINERAIYANVSTPDGIYVIQGNGQYAWMAETNDLSKEAVMDPM